MVTKHDPKYVDFKVVNWDDGKQVYVGGLHPCTKEDMAKFYKPAASHKEFEKYKNEWMCLDDFDKQGNKRPTKIFGSELGLNMQI